MIRSLEETADRSASGFDMHRVLGAFDLLLLGTGCIIGAGVVVLTVSHLSHTHMQALRSELYIYSIAPAHLCTALAM